MDNKDEYLKKRAETIVDVLDPMFGEYTGDGVAADADTIVWKIKLDYEIGEVGEIDVPDETLSKETIELLKKVYGYLE